MWWIEISMLAVLLASSIMSALSDFKKSVIPNNIMLTTAIIELLLSAVYYSVFARDIFFEYLYNLVVTAIISIMLYGFHIWGGGDSKMLIVIAIAYPARLYGYLNNEMFPLVNLFAIIFTIGFIYVVIDSIVMYLKKVPVAYSERKFNIRDFARDYFITIVYLTAITGAISIIGSNIFWSNPIVSVFFNFFVVYCIHSFEIFKKPWTITLAAFGTIGVWLVLKPHFGVTQLYAYAISIAVLILRYQIEKYNYLIMKPEQLTAGMVLSTATVLQFSGSRIHDLPHHITEDLRNKLSEKEVQAVKKWANSNPDRSIVIMRKVPFAVFILVGTVLFLAWGLLSANIF